MDLSLDAKVEDYMRKDLVTLDEGATVVEGARVMKRRAVGSIVVTKAGRPVGIVTERDILTRVVAEHRDPAKTLLREVMSSPLVSVPVGTTVREAVATMVKHNFRRLLVREGQRIVGIITQRSIVGDGKKYSAPLVELELPGQIMCPYCRAVLPDKKTLAKHLDNLIYAEACTR